MPLLFVILVAIAWLYLKGQSQAQTPADNSQADAEPPAVSPPVAPTAADGIGAYGNPQDYLDNILEGIFRQEGGNPGDRNVRNNNPMDLEHSSLATGNDGRFSIFSDMGDGWQAASDWVTSHAEKHPDWDFYDMFNYALRGSTKPAVDKEGDGNAYAENVAGYAGVDPATTVSSLLGLGN
jgi:hypothetical protein